MKEERKFLHDISSPITSLQLDLENAISILEETPSTNDLDQCLMLLRNSLGQIQRAVAFIRERREIIMQSDSS